MQGNWTQKIYTMSGFTKTDVLGGARALDVGCGGRKLPGAIGMDVLKLGGVDVTHDFNKIPWPFGDNSFDLVLMNHALEHVDEVVLVMNELHRILKAGGRLVIQVPYFRSTDAFTDPTHKHLFTSSTLDYVIHGTGLSKYAYSGRLFTKKGFWYGWPCPSSNPLKQLFKSFVASNQVFYDQYLSVLFPADCLTWELEVEK